MLKSHSRKTQLSVAGAAVTCIALLLVVAQRQRSATGGAQKEREVGLRSLQSLGEAAAEDAGQSEQAGGKRGFSAYFSKLTRSRREAERPAAGASASPPPAEQIGADDIFIAVKTTKKFHQSRLELLLDTWISRNLPQVSAASHASSLFLICGCHGDQNPTLIFSLQKVKCVFLG